jgi:CheY-like chemotaxis protein
MQRRILVVDDDELTRQQLQRLLEVEGGVKVDTTGDGALDL